MNEDKSLNEKLKRKIEEVSGKYLLKKRKYVLDHLRKEESHIKLDYSGTPIIRSRHEDRMEIFNSLKQYIQVPKKKCLMSI
ncbi:hypothetical protein AYI68_g3959 [Smittium mucronatum]|uniref:Uncharacterized protein n=1 Tax=Smittium mucronatum TaxID=133383 RepID=A0A1R0GYG9_9FUNG|nr:hypothetical protein AYI68_g3959 [Smittium mucronatum]